MENGGSKNNRSKDLHLLMDIPPNFSPEIFLALIENISETLAILNEEGIILYLTPSVQRNWGYLSEELLGKNWLSLILSEDVSEAEAQFASVRKEQGKIVKFEIRGLHKEGSVRWIEVTFTNFLQSPAVHGVILNVKDITESKKSAEALFISKEKFLTLAHNSEDVIARYDREFRYIYINPSVEKATGIPEEKFIGKTNGELGIPEDAARRWDAQLKAVFETGTTQKHSFRYNTPEGERFFQSLLIPELGPDGSVLSVISSTRDFTDILQKEKSLEQLNEELNTFLYKTSHDLRGPLASIQGLVLVAKEDSESVSRYLDFIMDTTRRMDHTLKGLKRIVKIKQEEVVFADIDFQRIIKGVIQNLEEVEDFGSVSIRYEVQGDGCPFFSDRELLHIIMENLMQNSIQYRDVHQEQSDILLHIHYSKEKARITIEDNGLGIDADIRGKIFKMFYRGNQKSKGAGLGLYIVNGAVELLQGKIELEQLETGCRFVIEIPNKYQRPGESGE